MIASLLFLAGLRTAVSQSCQPSCTDSTGTYNFDYTGLTKYQGGFLYQGTDGEYVYNMNMCANAWGSDCTGMLCQYSLPDNTFVSNIVYWQSPEGTSDQFEWVPVDEEDCTKGMRLNIQNVYNCSFSGLNGLPRPVSINMFCDPDGPEIPTTFAVNEGSTCAYEVNFYTQSACDTSFVCQSAPCENGGVCVPDSSTQAGYTCDCLAGWGGYNCESASLCFPNPCFNSGTCTVNEAGTGYSCECLSAYTGTNCEGRACDGGSGWRGWGIFCLLVVIAGVLYLGVKFYQNKQSQSVGFTDGYEGGSAQQNI